MSQPTPPYGSQQQPPVWSPPPPTGKQGMSTGAKVMLFGCIGLVVVIIGLVAFAIVLNWGKIKSELRTDGNSRQVIISSDGQFQLQVPSGWRQATDLNEKAELQAADRLREMYVVVLSENKMDFEEMSLDKHSQITRENLVESLTSTETSGPTTLVINGSPAVQYFISGTVDNLRVTYLHTTVETSKSFNQILAWTLRSRFEQNRAELQDVIQSFKEASDGNPAK